MISHYGIIILVLLLLRHESISQLRNFFLWCIPLFQQYHALRLSNIASLQTIEIDAAGKITAIPL